MSDQVPNQQPVSNSQDVSAQPTEVQEDFSGLAASLMPGLVETDAFSEPAPKAESSEQASEKKVEKKEEAEPNLKELKQLYHNRLATLDSREEKLNIKVSKLKDQVAIVAAAEKALSADVTLLTRGDGRQVLDALARITKRDPSAIYEEMGMALLGKKQDPHKAKVEELEARIEELTRGAKEREEQNTQQLTATKVRAEIRQFSKDDEQWPLIAAEVNALPDKALDTIEEIYTRMCEEAESWLDTGTVFDRIERGLRKQAKDGRAGTAKPAAGSGPGLEQGTQDRNPATAQRPPTSIPSTASTSSYRELDDPRDRDRDIVANMPSLFAELGL